MLSTTAIIYLVLLGLPIIVYLIARPVYGVLLLAFIYPLIFISKNNVGYTIFMNIYRLIFIITFASWLVSVLLKKRPLFLYKQEWYVALLAIGALIVSLKAGEFISEPIQGIAFFKYIMYAAMFIMIPNLLDSQDRIKQFFMIFIVSTSFVSLLGIMQYYTGITLVYDIDPQYIGYSPSTRLFVGIDSNPNSVAVIQLISLCSIACYLMYGEFYKQTPLVILLFIILGAMLLGQSRSAIGAFFLSVGITIILTNVKKLRSGIFYSLLVLLFFVLFLHLSNSYLEERLVFDSFTGKDLEYRLIQARAALLLFIGDPLGVGGDYSRLLFQYGGIAFASTHNIFLRIMLDTGIIGFLGYMAIIISVLSFLIKRCRENLDMGQKILVTSLLAAILSFLIQAQVHHILWEYPFWMLVGLSLYFRNNTGRRESKAFGPLAPQKTSHVFRYTD